MATYERAPTGLADIWSAMVTAYWWAAEHGVRFRVHWPESEGTVVLPRAPSDDARRWAANLTYFKRSHVQFRRDWLRRDQPTRDVVLTGNRGLTAWFVEHFRVQGVPRDPLLAAGCALHLLARPTEASYHLAAPLLETRPTVCLHIRTGLMLNGDSQGSRGSQGSQGSQGKGRPDDEMHGAQRRVTSADVRAFLECAEELSGGDADGGKLKDEAGPAPRWFVAADSASLRADLVERYGDRVVLAPWSPDPFASYQAGGGSRGGSSRRRRSPLPGQERGTFDAAALSRTFAEWYALAHCDIIVASRSGFSRTAAVVARAMRNASVRIVPRADEQRCRPTSQDRTDRLLLDGGAGV